MGFSLSAETQRMIEERMLQGGYATPDDLVREALEFLDQAEVEELDEETLDAIDEAEEGVERGEFQPWDEVEKELRAKYLGE